MAMCAAMLNRIRAAQGNGTLRSTVVGDGMLAAWHRL